jgi:hypothetical protein
MEVFFFVILLSQNVSFVQDLKLILTMTQGIRSWDSSVGIVTRLWTGGLRILDSILNRGLEILLLFITSKVISYTMDTKG